ncbi:hypothetical protein MAR_004256 [Mya arenaria]|uniref:CCHC-type domain-containing protein n=1 Tax=Mya arenaria TaxID=6604 RepID=A0ABY7EZR8_MYAAR|nr:hypothetical protein MAR_004256 [Mya arenaria]
MKTNKAAGPDELSNIILKTCAEELAPAISSIFQRSIDSGELPDNWRSRRRISGRRTFCAGWTLICFKCGSEGYFVSECAADLQGTTNFMGIGRGRGVTRPVAATASPRTQLFVPANGGQ